MGEDTFISRQVQVIILACVSAGIVLSAVGPASGFIEAPNAPILWGLVYATMAFMMGVVFDRAFLVSGIFIFVGVIAAIAQQSHAGIILGPFMGLGMIVPGRRAFMKHVERLERIARGEQD